MIKKHQSANVLVRLPPALKAWIVEEAARNCASHNSEIVRSIRDRMERERAAASLAKAKERLIVAAAAAE
jgi:CRISPR/Cas system-associated protein Csm6